MNFAGGMILSVLLLALVSGATFSGAKPAHAAVPGKNGRIIFVGHCLGNPDSGIYAINPDGSDARMISGYGRELG
jgi:hypothetical protein